MMLGYDLQGKFTVVALHCAFSCALPRISSFVPVDKIKQKRYVRRRIHVVVTGARWGEPKILKNSGK